MKKKDYREKIAQLEQNIVELKKDHKADKLAKAFSLLEEVGDVAYEMHNEYQTHNFIMSGGGIPVDKLTETTYTITVRILH